MKTKKGFTLVELLVVISIIALLLSILMPSLSRARESGRRVVCLSNQRQLSLAWVLYTQNNNDYFCSPDPAEKKNTEDYKYSWLGWNYETSKYLYLENWTLDDWSNAIQEGKLWKYTQNEKIYRCPTGNKGEMVTYAAFGGALGWRQPLKRDAGPSYGTFLYKMTDLQRASERAVFIDEGKLSLNFFSVNYSAEEWFDRPPIRHNIGATLSFADAHAEYWKWQDDRTKKLGMMDDDTYWKAKRNSPDNVDLQKMRIAAWGKLGGRK